METKRLKTSSGAVLALILLPAIAADDASPDDRLSELIRHEAEEAGLWADLVIGVSPWGFFPEERYLGRGDAPFDLVLGGGTGPGTDKLVANGRTLWIRPSPKGKTISLVHLTTESPGPDGWSESEYQVESIRLDDSIPEDASVLTLF